MQQLESQPETEEETLEGRSPKNQLSNTGHCCQEAITFTRLMMSDAWARVPSSLQKFVVFQHELICYKWTGDERKGKWLLSIVKQNHASSQNDLHDDTSAAAVAKIAGRKVLGGRNMLKCQLLKREIDKNEGSNERPEISGKEASKKSSKGAEYCHSNTQDKNMSQQVEQESAQKEYASGNHPGYSLNSTPLDSLNFKAASSKASVFVEHHDESAQKDNSKEFLEAADKVVNLMHKDYRGMDRPRRKPPVNNNEPTD